MVASVNVTMLSASLNQQIGDRLDLSLRLRLHVSMRLTQRRQ